MAKKKENSSFSDEVDIDGVVNDFGKDARTARRLKRTLVSRTDMRVEMRKKRKSSSFSNEVDIDGVADDSEYDVRLARRLKRKLASNIDTKLKSLSNKSFKGGKGNGASQKFQEVNRGNGDDDDDVDADYKQYLDSLCSNLAGDDDGDGYENVPLQIGPLNIDAGTNHNRNLESPLNIDGGTNRNRNLESNNNETGGSRGEILDASYYLSYLDILGLEDENACFLDRGHDVDAVIGFAEKDNNGGEDSVGEKFVNCDFSDAHNFRKRNRNSDCMDGVPIAIDAESMENATFSNISKGSGNVGQSRNSDACQDDDLAYIDPAYDFVLKNVMNERSDTFINFLDEEGSLPNQSMNNNTSPNNALDDNDPDYDFFMKNVRQDGTSLVLEIPVLDGISQIVRYELGDGSRVENTDTTRSSQEELCEPDLMDEAYGGFLKSLKIEKGLVVFMPECGPQVVYDEVEESSSDSDVVILETDPFVQTYDVPSDDEEECNKGWFRENDRWFREKVMAILKKPFDKEEYERLLQDAKAHKPVFEEKEMRHGRSRRLEANKTGKSYLDVHKDLMREINLARSSEPKILNLLRGFFFWLQNVAHEVFKPWKDEQCLQVLPSPDTGYRN